MYILSFKFSTQGCTTQAVNASEYANTRPHVCAPVLVSVHCSVVLLVAPLQDCVEAVCNKCAQASGPRKIYHKQEGRQSAQGKEEDGASGAERGNK